MNTALATKKNRQKVTVAIIAGVNAYIQGEEIQVEETAGRTVVERKPAVAVNMWPIMGREEIMRMSQLWQRRIV